MERKIWTEAEKAIIRQHYPDLNTADLVQMFPDRTASQIYQQAAKLGVKKSEAFKASDKACRIKRGIAPGAVRHQFAKGNIPFNKGKAGGEYLTPEAFASMAKTQFKKGTVPPNHRPVGYERMTRDGYLEVKVAEGMQQFRPKHHLVYEQHYGAIPKGQIVVFKDNNPLNIAPENLLCITRAENMKRNSWHNWPEELAQNVQLRGALNRQINKRIKQLTNEK